MERSGNERNVPFRTLNKKKDRSYWLLSKRVVKRKSDRSGPKMVSNSFDKIINWFRILTEIRCCKVFIFKCI